MCKHVHDKQGAWQPYYSEETVSGERRFRGRGIMRQAVCKECGEVLGLPRKSQLSAPYRQAAAALARKHDLPVALRRLISQKLARLDDADLSRTRREDVFINAFQRHSSISENEILITVAKI
jgi:hypothetical protein